MLKVIWIAVISSLRVLFRRPFRGPLLPSWSWGLEIGVETARGVLVEMNTWPPERMQAMASGGRPTAIDKQVERVQVTLGGVPAERTDVPGVSSDGRVLMYIHGGGMVLGSPAGHRDLVSRIAVEAGVRAFSLDYRLAPQHPYPAAVDDVFAAYEALLEEGVQPENLVVGGDSAGGVLTLALLQRIREVGLPHPSGAVAICPAPDLSFPAESWTRNAPTDYLSLAVVRQWIDHYAKPDQLRDPLVSTIYGDFSGCPPILVQVGEAECLFDEVVALVEKLEAAKVDVTFERYAEMPHVWHLFRAVAPEGDVAIRSIGEFVRARTS